MSGSRSASLTTVVLDGRVLQERSGVRGIGSYLRGLLGGLERVAAGVDIRLLLQAHRPGPPELSSPRIAPGPRLRVLKRRLQPLLDPLLVTAALRGSARGTVYHAVEYAQPLVARVPVVVTVHDLIPFLFGDEYRWMRRERLLALRLLRRADAVVAVSRSTAEDAVRIAGVDPSRVTVIHHGVDERFRPARPDGVVAVRRRVGLLADEPYLLSVGVLDAHKRLPLLLDVVGRLRRDHPVRLVVAGAQAEYLPRVRDAIAAAALDDAVLLAGHLAAGDLVALYSGASCVLVSSAYEGFGLPVVEAMASGAPVIAFANSAIPEVCGDAGILVEDGNAAAMAAAASSLLDDPRERGRRVDAGRSWATGFTWERSARAHLEVYRRVLG